ncbi:MAG: hypothetical protein K2N60_01765 [Oscillospiraceae bacterium]|nr:hypothetical protein [Oscillospiraceae bacterium]
MNLKLSYRDKVIFIVVMVILVLVAGFFIFIKPKFEQVDLAKVTLAEKQQEKADIDAKIGTLSDIIDNMKAAAEEIGEKQEIFLDEAHPYVNETYIRDALSSLNLDITSMNTTYTTAAAINRYTVAKQHYLAYENKMNADLYNELPQEVYNLYNGVPAQAYPNTIIGVTNVTLTFDLANGSINKVYDVMDRLAEDEKTIVLNSVSAESEPENENEAEASVNLTMYSIFPLNVEEVLKETDEVKPIEPAAEEAAEPAA